MITFKYESYQGEVQIEYKTDREPLGDVVEDFRAFLLAVGYAPGTIKRYVGDDE